jgi:hypothetical protein
MELPGTQEYVEIFAKTMEGDHLPQIVVKSLLLSSPG